MDNLVIKIIMTVFYVPAKGLVVCKVIDVLDLTIPKNFRAALS